MLNLNFEENARGSKVYRVYYSNRGRVSAIIGAFGTYENARKAFEAYSRRASVTGNRLVLREIEEVGYGPISGPVLSDLYRNKAA